MHSKENEIERGRVKEYSSNRRFATFEKCSSRSAAFEKCSSLCLGHQCSRTRNWLLDHLKYISIIKPKERIVHCLICRDKKEYILNDIINHFMCNHYDEFIL